MLSVISMMVFGTLTIVACGSSEIAGQINNGKITICQATGGATDPYSEITLNLNELNGHSDHEGDTIPAPENGCASNTTTPTVTAMIAGDNAGKVTICHATGSSKKPYVLIIVSVSGLNGHGSHSRDIIPAPAGGCPK